MIRNYYTLKKVCADIQKLKGFYITECFTQDKDVLTLQCENGSQTEYLNINCETKDSAVYLKAHYSRARKNTLDVLTPLVCHTITSIDLVKGERTLIINAGAFKLVANIFGGAKSNAFLVNSDGKIIDAFKSKKDFLDKDLIINLSPAKKFSKFDANENILSALTKCDLNIGKHYSLELLERLNIDKEAKLGDLSIENIKLIEETAKEIFTEIEGSQAYFIGMTESKEMLLSLINLKAFGEIRGEYKDLSNAILRRIVNKSQNAKFDNYYQDLHRKLSAKKKRMEQAIRETDNVKLSIERAAKYKLWAESLLYGTDLQTANLETIERELWDGEKIKIPLEKKLSIAENANRYFEKSKKTSEEAKSREKLKIKLELELIKVNSLFDNLKNANNFEELEKIKSKMSEEANINSGAKSENAKKFREFDLGDGYTLYVGKNAANNDELTVRFAKPNDIWMHARSVGGSHGVIRINGDKKPPKKTIEKAGMIIAYYSQAKHGKFVPVSYTLKKYVNKPRGSNPGSVTISREEVVMVEPKLWTPELE